MGGMTKRLTQQERRTASYEALVRAAMRRLQEQGYAQTTVADIVADTDYSSGAFYHHFANKADCLWHVLAYREHQRADWGQLAAELATELATNGDRSLHELIEQVLAQLASTVDGANAWVLVMVEFARRHRDDPAVRARLREVYLGWVDELVAFVELLRRHGYVAADRDTHEVATEMFAYFEGINVHREIYSGDPALYARLLVDGLVRLLSC